MRGFCRRDFAYQVGGTGGSRTIRGYDRRTDLEDSIIMHMVDRTFVLDIMLIVFAQSAFQPMPIPEPTHGNDMIATNFTT